VERWSTECARVTRTYTHAAAVGWTRSKLFEGVTIVRIRPLLAFILTKARLDISVKVLFSLSTERFDVYYRARVYESRSRDRLFKTSILRQLRDVQQPRAAYQFLSKFRAILNVLRSVSTMAYTYRVLITFSRKRNNLNTVFVISFLKSNVAVRRTTNAICMRPNRPWCTPIGVDTEN